MLFNWDITSEHKINLSAQELYETLLTRISVSDSKFEVRNAEYGVDTFKIVAALKSKAVYIVSYTGKYTNFDSPVAVLSYTDGKVVVEVKIPVLSVIWELLAIFAMLVFEKVAFRESFTSGLIMLVPSVLLVVPSWYTPHRLAKKCHKEALRCLTESACAAGGKIETVE